MRNLIYDDDIYSNIFIDKNRIIKYSFQTPDAWNSLMCKNLPFLNIPKNYAQLSEEEEKDYPNSTCKIELPFLSGYSTLYKIDFMHTFDSKQILLLLRKMLISLKEMHEQDVYHGDLFSKNIMINKSLDFSFIDLEASIIDDIVSDENTYSLSEMSLEDKKLYTLNDDKFGIFLLFLYYFIHGNFNTGIDYRIDTSKLYMPKIIIDEINYCLKCRVIDSDYYFEDIVDELLSIGYKPKIYTK